MTTEYRPGALGLYPAHGAEASWTKGGAAH